MKSIDNLIGGALVGLLLMTACTATPTIPATSVAPATGNATSGNPTPTVVLLAARVNGVAIPMSQYEQEVSRYEASLATNGQDPNSPEMQAALAQGRQQVLDWLIDQVLIDAEATKAGITVSDVDVDAVVNSLIQEVGQEAFNQRLQDEGMTVEQMRERLKQEMRVSRMVSQVVAQVPARAEHIHARHILVRSEADAQQIFSQLQAGGDFAQLARTYSLDASTRELGGDLGTFPRGVLTASEVETMLFSLQPGQFGGPVQSELGYHVVQLVERFPDMETSQENLHFLWDKAERLWRETLRTQADIQRYVTPGP